MHFRNVIAIQKYSSIAKWVTSNMLFKYFWYWEIFGNQPPEVLKLSQAPKNRMCSGKQFCTLLETKLDNRCATKSIVIMARKRFAVLRIALDKRRLNFLNEKWFNHFHLTWMPAMTIEGLFVLNSTLSWNKIIVWPSDISLVSNRQMYPNITQLQISFHYSNNPFPTYIPTIISSCSNTPKTNSLLIASSFKITFRPGINAETH